MKRFTIEIYDETHTLIETHHTNDPFNGYNSIFAKIIKKYHIESFSRTPYMVFFIDNTAHKVSMM